MSLDIIGPANAPNSTTTRPTDDRSFGVTDTWFQDCTSPSANDGTKLKASFMNAVAGAFRALVRSNGNTALAAPIVVENNADDAMALKAIQHQIQRGLTNYSLDTGGTNSVIVAPSPPVAEYKTGLVIRTKIAATNTGSATVNVSGIGAAGIARWDGSPIQAGDLTAGAVVALFCDSTAGHFKIMTPTPAQVMAGRNQQVFTASGGFSVPPGVTQIFVKLWAGGGGGGGGNNSNYGCGGAGGGYAEGSYTVTPGAGISVIIGAGGAYGVSSGGDGTNGGSSSFGSYCSATGGQGGKGNQSAASSGTPVALGGSGTGGALNWVGCNGGTPLGTWNSTFAGGQGGGAYGSPGGVSAQGQQGQVGSGPGAGAAGGSSATGPVAQPGGQGRDGLIIVTW